MAVALPAILAAAEVRTPVIAAVAVALSAVAAIFAGFWRGALTEVLQRDRAEAMSIRDGCLTVRGHLPRVRDIAEPTWLGVHAAREAPAGSASTVGHQPPYVPRDIDDDLREHLAAGGFLLLVGDSTAGKTRAAYEGIAATLPDHTLLAPQYRRFLMAALDRARHLPRSVLWLDDLERFLGEEGLTRARIIRLLDDSGQHHAMVATIRAAELDTYTHADNAARPLARDVLDCLALAKRIDIPRLLSPAELSRAAARTWDSRITEALDHADRFGLAEYLTAGPELLHLWRAARDGGPHVLGAALVAAAVDCRRAGLTCPLPREVIESLARGYLPSRGGVVVAGEPTADAWTWATQVGTTTALLTSVSPDTFGVFDYLVDEVERTATSPVPEVALTTVLSCADAPDAMRIGTIARVHGRYEIAMRAYSHAREVRTAALGPRHADTLTSWGNWAAVLRSLGRLKEAEAEHRAVLDARMTVLGPNDPATVATRTNLALVLHDLGRLEEARTELLAALQARTLALGPDHPSTLTNRNNLAFVLHDLGQLTEAETEHCTVLAAYIRILGQEESDKPVNVAAVLRALGSLEDAEAEHRAILDTSTRVLGADHPDAITSRGRPTLVLHAVERLGEAESMHRNVYSGYLRVLGPGHPSTLTARSNLAVIGARFVIDHGMGTVIGEQVEIGRDCYLLQNVVLGGRSIGHSSHLTRSRRHPRIGDRVEIGANAMVLGAVTVGDDCQLDPGVRVTTDVPSRSRVRMIAMIEVTMADTLPEIHGLALALDELLICGLRLSGCLPVLVDSDANLVGFLPVYSGDDTHIKCRIAPESRTPGVSAGLVVHGTDVIAYVTPNPAFGRA